MRASVIDAKREISENHRALLFGEPVKNRKDFGQFSSDGKELVIPEDEVRAIKAIKALEVLQEKLKANEGKYIPKYMWLDKLIISASNKYKSAWDILIILLIIYSSITSAYLLAFDIKTEDHVGFNIFNTYIAEILFAIDIILTFFQEYKDPQNFEFVRDPAMIALKYLKSWFIVDFIAVFPFEIFTDFRAFRLLRILRLPRLLKFLDGAKFDKFVGGILQNTSRQKRMTYLYASKYVYKVVRLILIATVLTYFLGCFWYFIITEPGFHDDQVGFYEEYNIDELSLPRRLVLCCYFALTTLSTVGYGDLTPKSNIERIFGIIIMILGIALFSYIMGNFNDVLTNYDKQMGIVDKSADLQVWITSLTKFTNNQALPRELVQKIDEHFKFVWKNDRLSSLTPDDQYLKQMPKPLKHRLIKYLFDDIFSLFRGFLLTNEFRDSPFYYDLAFEILPRKYDAKEMILKQGEPVHEIYLIKEGSVFIYFEHEGKQIGKFFGKGYFFGNYNIFRNVPAEFHYQAIKGTENAQSTKVLAIPKANLLKILSKYPDIFARMADNSKRNSNSLKEIMKHELKATLLKQNSHANPTQTQIEDIFKECVTDKVRKNQSLLKETVKKISINEFNEGNIGNKLNLSEANAQVAPNKGVVDPSADFRKAISKDLLEITNKLQRVRDKLAVREKKNDS